MDIHWSEFVTNDEIHQYLFLPSPASAPVLRTFQYYIFFQCIFGFLKQNHKPESYCRDVRDTLTHRVAIIPIRHCPQSLSVLLWTSSPRRPQAGSPLSSPGLHLWPTCQLETEDRSSKASQVKPSQVAFNSM